MIFKPFEDFGIYDCILFLTLTYVAYYYYKYFTRVNPLPGPFPFPLVGNFPQILWSIGNIEMFFNCCYKKYGDIYEIYTINIRTIVLCRGKYLDNILSNNTHEMRFPDCKIITEEFGLEGKGLALNNDYKSWMFNHHFFNQAILSPKFTNEAIEQTNKLFNELESYWSNLFLKEEIIKENKNKLDFSKWFQYYTNDIIIKLLAGKRSYSMAAYFNTLGGEDAGYPSARVEDSVKLFRKTVAGYSIFFVIPPFIRRYVPFFKNKADGIHQTLDFLNQTLITIIKNRRQEIEDTPLNEPLQHDMLTSMIIKNTLRDNYYIETGEAMRSLTDAEIRANMQEAIVSATLKVGNMLSFIVYYIAHNLDVKEKLLREIDSIFQGDKTRPITKDDFYSLNYCEAIVKEAARIFPVGYSFTRYFDKPCEIAEYNWPAGILFLIYSKAIQNNNDWEEPNKFNPDRWMVENFEPNKNSFLMFGGGLRSCPGRKLSMIELVCLTALMFRKYEIDLVDMNAPIKVTSDPGLVKCLNLLVEIRPRN